MRLDQFAGQLVQKGSNSLPSFDRCPAWTRCSRDAIGSLPAGVGSDSEAYNSGPAYELLGIAQQAQQGEENVQQEHYASSESKAAICEIQEFHTFSSKQLRTLGDRSVSEMSSSASKGLLNGDTAMRATWGYPEHRRDWDLFWLEEVSGRRDDYGSASPALKAAARCRAPGAAAAAAAAVVIVASTQGSQMPVLLSSSEAARVGSRTGWRLRSLEKNTMRSLTKS